MAVDTSALTVAAPEYKRGPAAQPGQGQQLPYGEAQQLNDQSQGVPTTPIDPAIALAQGQMTQPPPPSGVGPAAPPYRASTDEERYLFSPTERPNQNIMSGVFSGAGMTPPDEAYEALDLLRVASSDPTSSPQIRFLHDLLLRYMQ